MTLQHCAQPRLLLLTGTGRHHITPKKEVALGK